MARKTTQDSYGTSFHNGIIRASFNDLVQTIGEPQYVSQHAGIDKVNYEWVMETTAGVPFTIYDWKEYRRIQDHEIITWHIGALSSEDSEIAQIELENLLAENR